SGMYEPLVRCSTFDELMLALREFEILLSMRSPMRNHDKDSYFSIESFQLRLINNCFFHSFFSVLASIIISQIPSRRASIRQMSNILLVAHTFHSFPNAHTRSLASRELEPFQPRH